MINHKISLLLIFTTVLLFYSVDNAFAEETQSIEIEIKYTDGDRAEYEGTKILGNFIEMVKNNEKN